MNPEPSILNPEPFTFKSIGDSIRMQADVLGISILIGSFFTLLAIRVPVAFSLGITSVLTAWYLDLPLMIVLQQMTKGLDSIL